MSGAIVPDSEHRGLVAMLPQPIRDFAMLARFDRPIGWWLLLWPCWWSTALAATAFARPGDALSTAKSVTSAHS